MHKNILIKEASFLGEKEREKFNITKLIRDFI